METPIVDGGSMELVQAGNNINGTFYFSYRHLQTLASELVVPKILVCPADLARQSARTFGVLQNSNVSYFVNVYADYSQPLSILSGDRNITNDARATASLVRGAYGLRWTSELHFFKGNVLFSDAHVEQLNNVRMDVPLAANSVLFLPAVRPTPGGGPSSPPGGGSPGPLPASGGGGSPPSSPSSPTPAPMSAGNNSSNAPAAQFPTPTPPARSGMSGSRTAGHEGSSDTTITETHARETNEVAVPATPHQPPPRQPTTRKNPRCSGCWAR